MFTAAMWQGLQNDSISAGNTRLLMIFVGIVALSMLSQAIVVVFLAVKARGAQVQALRIVEELRGRIVPILGTTEEILNDTKPKIRAISDNLLKVSDVVKVKAQELDSTITDVNIRTKAQVARVDGMVSSALTATGTLAAMVHHSIKVPVTEIMGVVNGFKAGVDVLFSKSKGFTGNKDTMISLYKGDRSGS